MLTFDPEDFHGLFNPFPRNLRQIVLQPQFPFTGRCQYGRKFGFKKNELETFLQNVFVFHFKKEILKNTSHGDFLLLTFLFDNMNSIVSREFVKKCVSEDWNDQYDKWTN